MFRPGEDNMIPLRMFMGLQMIAYGTLTWIDPSDLKGPVSLDEYGWLWSVLLILGGLWLGGLAALELYASWNWKGMGRKTCRRCIQINRWLAVHSYFLSGAVWVGLSRFQFLDGHYQTSDFLGPVFILFLVFIAYKDACRKRKRVLRNEASR